jgi:hypothetical protein
MNHDKQSILIFIIQYKNKHKKGGTMYQLYIKNETSFSSKKFVGEFRDIDKVYEKIENELAKNKDIKYVIEETTGHVDSYGELTTTVIEEN